VSWRNFIDVLEIFEECPGNIRCVSWRFLIGVMEIFDGSLQILNGNPGGI